jgi:hypothetical protein
VYLDQRPDPIQARTRFRLVTRPSQAVRLRVSAGQAAQDAHRRGKARYGIVTLIGRIPRCTPATSHDTPVRVMCGRDFRHIADESAVSLLFGQGPAGTSACLR